MEITSMKCPNCSGSISYETGQHTVKCPSCDSVLKIKVEPEEIKLEKIKKDHKNIEQIRHDYAKSVHQWKGRTYIYYGLVVLLTITGFLLIYLFRNHSGMYNLGGIIILLLFISFAAVPLFFTLTVPVAPKEVEEQLKVKAGFLTAAKIAVIAVLLALAAAFIFALIANALGPSAARLQERAEITISEGED